MSSDFNYRKVIDSIDNLKESVIKIKEKIGIEISK